MVRTLVVSENVSVTVAAAFPASTDFLLGAAMLQNWASGSNRGLCERLMASSLECREKMQARLDYLPGRHVTRDLIHDEADLEKAIDLIRTYFALGGQYVQVTVASAEELRAAMREPEKWGHLIVRVGGYSAYFTTLDPRLQQSIIERTAYEGR